MHAVVTSTMYVNMHLNDIYVRRKDGKQKQNLRRLENIRGREEIRTVVLLNCGAIVDIGDRVERFGLHHVTVFGWWMDCLGCVIVGWYFV